MAAQIDWQPGDVFLDHFRVERLLGAGGMGKVYRVEHLGWGTSLVVKVPRAELVDDVTHMLSFERECETWISLGHHPNIVSCYFVRRHEALPLIFAEYAPYGSLHDWIAHGRLYQGGSNIVLARILDIAIQFAQGLAFAHERGLVHQDVKPANVMIGDDRTAKVTDFGLARAHAAIGASPVRSGGAATVTAGGMTPAYCSPEQASHERLTAKTDVWSWAVSVMEMFTGGCHWMSGVAARDVLKEHVRQQHLPDRQGQKIPRDLGLLLDTCFRTEPDRRPVSMEAIVRDLHDIYLAACNEVYPRMSALQSPDPTDPSSIANANNRAISKIELGETDEAIEILKETELNARAYGDFGAGTELQDLAYNQALLQIRTNPVYNVDYVPSLIPKRPNELRQEWLVGMLFLEAGRLPEAVEQLTRPAQRASEFQSDALNARGIALLLAGESAPAILSFETAVRLDPDRLEYLRNLAIARYYHGDTYAALTLFERLSGQQRLDATDAVRFAAVLSSAGQPDRSAQFLNQLRVTGSPTAATLTTAAEVGFGAQSFLPDLTPVSDDPDECRRWVLEALAREPDSLRAEIDRRRLPHRVVLFPECRLRRGKRVPPDPNDPEETADRLAASYEPLQGHTRWGDLPGGEGLRLRVATTILPILLGVLCGMYLFDRETLIEVFGSDRFGVQAGCWTTLVVSTAFVVLRPRAALSATRTVAGFCVALPALIMVPTLIHQDYLVEHGAAVTAHVAEPRALARFTGEYALVLALLVLGRDLPFRTLGSRLRAWGEYGRPAEAIRREQPGATTTTGITAVARLSAITQNVRVGAVGFSARPVTRRSRYWSDRLAALPAHWTPKLEIALRRYGSRSGGWHLLLLPQFVALAVLDTSWVALLPEAPMGTYGAYMLAAQLAFWALLPLIARPFVIVNFVMGPIVAIEFVSSSMPDAVYATTWTALFSGFFLALNALALRRCPAFAPLWKSVPRGMWNVGTLIDPLDMRRYAAPWRLIRVTSGVEKL